MHAAGARVLRARRGRDIRLPRGRSSGGRNSTDPTHPSMLAAASAAKCDVLSRMIDHYQLLLLTIKQKMAADGLKVLIA